MVSLSKVCPLNIVGCLSLLEPPATTLFSVKDTLVPFLCDIGSILDAKNGSGLQIIVESVCIVLFLLRGALTVYKCFYVYHLTNTESAT